MPSNPIPGITSLPWKLFGCNIAGGPDFQDTICSNGRGGNQQAWIDQGNINMEYIVHAANRLPELEAENERLRKALSGEY